MSDAASAVQGIIDGEEEADEILRAVVGVLAGASGGWAGIRFVEEGGWVTGPLAGAAGAEAEAVPVRYDGELVAELVSGAPLDDAARASWAAVADLVAVFCLVGWDTGGESWEP